MTKQFDPQIDAMPSEPASTRLRGGWLLATVAAAVIIGGALLVVLFGWLTPAGGIETAPLGGQGGEGVWANDAVTLERRSDALVVTLSAPRPEPGTYSYPPPETPAGDPTPVPGPGETEVFTLWIFLFNHPEACVDANVCRMVDILPDATTGTAPAAQGAVYQLDGVIADGDWLDMSGTISVASPSNVGAVLTEPLCAHVHIGMAPHGRALTGADLQSQLTDAVGNPDFWWPAQFENIDPSLDC